MDLISSRPKVRAVSRIVLLCDFDCYVPRVDRSVNDVVRISLRRNLARCQFSPSRPPVTRRELMESNGKIATSPPSAPYRPRKSKEEVTRVKREQENREVTVCIFTAMAMIRLHRALA